MLRERTSPQILMIEDDTVLREGVLAHLALDAYTASGVSTGQEGLHEIRAGRADLVLLDVGLPDCNGFALYHEIRSISPEIPVIFLTGRGEVIDRVTGLELGADDYVVKPFDYRELLARVRGAIRRIPKTPVRAYGDGPLRTPFRVEPEKRRIYLDGTVLELTPLEYGILRMLVSQPGHVYSREYLIDALWIDPLVPSDRSIDQHVKTIRRKIAEVIGEVPAIETHRGAGYSLREDWD